MTTPPDVIHVVLWFYSDGSGFGVVRAFKREADAEDMRSLLNDQAGGLRSYRIEKANLVEEVLP